MRKDQARWACGLPLVFLAGLVGAWLGSVYSSKPTPQAPTRERHNSESSVRQLPAATQSAPMRQRRLRLSSRAVLSIAVVAVVALGIWFTIFLWEDCGGVGSRLGFARSDSEWRYWMQFFAGSTWPSYVTVSGSEPRAYPDSACLPFTFAATFHFVLNAAFAIGLVIAFVEWLRYRRRPMRIANIIERRDSALKVMIKNYIMDSEITMEAAREKSQAIDRIFGDSRVRLETLLIAEFGRVEAERIMSALKEEMSADL